MEAQEWYLAHQKKVNSYYYAMGILSYEVSTKVGSKVIPVHQEVMHNLRNEVLTYLDNEALQERILNLDISEFDELVQKMVKQEQKDILKSRRVPLSLKQEYYEIHQASANAWENAKANNDYSLFKTELARMIEVTKRMADCYEGEGSVYDKILNEREEGTSMAFYDELFSLIRKEIVPLIKNIKEEPNNTEFISDLNKQEAFIQELIKIVGFDTEAGRISASTHPFSSGIDVFNVRFTTAYYPKDATSAFHSTMHEVGHALYEQHTNPQFSLTNLREKSTSMHEGQSRLFEINLGLNQNFLKAIYPKLAEILENETTYLDFYEHLNQIKKSTVRLEADQYTYPLHIMVRYELEKKIFNENLAIDDLPQVFDDLIYEYLGLRANDIEANFLQDVHWSWGYFGYFPTYVLGSAYAAQLYHYLKQSVAVDEDLAKLDFSEINEWLRANVHQYAGTLENEVILENLGEKFNPQYYIDFLKEQLANK